MLRSFLSSRTSLRRAGSVLAAGSIALLGLVTGPVHAATVGAVQSYLVTYKDGASSGNAAADIQGAGGALVYNYQEIGVAVAKSNRSDFATNLQSGSNIDSVVATAQGVTRLKDEEPDANATDTGTDPFAGGLAGLQWDMTQIHAPEAHAITGGSQSVVVGDIDTGADPGHQDLAPNIDLTKSVSCIGGVPNTSVAAWKDDNGHGTHTAGIIAGAGVGITGVAPRVKLAIIKAGDVDGFFFPEAVVCAFHWAGTHHINVTNNSYFADPFYFNCKNDPAQFAIWKAEDRAIRFAMQNGTTVVAAEGNFADDLAHPTQDLQSPDTLPTPPPPRPVTNACVVIPVEIPGVIGVTADGNLRLKSFYSNYGDSVTQVTAPGGDSVLQRTPQAPNGRVLSSFPSYPVAIVCTRKVVFGASTYCYLQGTSMASPHVAGVAALIESMGITRPGAVQARIINTADGQGCPTAQQLALYAFFPSVNNGAPQACTGGTGYNSWFGHGQVNALAAVS